MRGPEKLEKKMKKSASSPAPKPGKTTAVIWLDDTADGRRGALAHLPAEVARAAIKAKLARPASKADRAIAGHATA